MAYYGAFCAAKAVLALHREGAKTHKGVNKQFFRLAVVDSDFPADTASAPGRINGCRRITTYRSLWTIGKNMMPPLQSTARPASWTRGKPV